MLPEEDARGPRSSAVGTTQAHSPPRGDPATASLSAQRPAPSGPGGRDAVPLIPLPLSQDAFSPYGSVLRRADPVRVNEGFATRADTLTPLTCSDPSARLCLSLFEVGVRPALVVVSELERHPHSAQVFLPVSPCRVLVVVAVTAADGNVDPDSIAAFVSAPGDGILYAPGVWHLGLSSLDKPGQFQMAMWSGDLPDTQVRRLLRPATIDMRGSPLLLAPDETTPR